MRDDPNFPNNLSIRPSTRAVLGPGAFVEDELPVEDDGPSLPLALSTAASVQRADSSKQQPRKTSSASA